MLHTQIDQQILRLSENELDTFPLGIIQLDRNATIVYYNEANAVLAKRTAATTVGLNFFRDVAPCAAVQEFEGRFREFVRTDESRCEKFTFVFRFAWGHTEVGITMVRRAGADERIYIVVNSSIMDHERSM